MTALSGLLDELMGKNRNAAPNEKTNELHWSDEEVCKHFLSGFCPAELFTNTRSDLGACNKTHDEQTRKTYEQSSRYMKMGYEEEFLRFLQQCWQDVERRIRRNHQRLQLSEEKNQQKQQPVQSAETEEKIQLLNDRITEMLENIEKLGSEGEVEQAQSMMKLCDQLKEEREVLQTQKGGIMDTFSVQEKQMEVCEVCGAFLIVGDAQSRVDDHLTGKQHMGYAKIKTAIVELKERLMMAAERNTRDQRSEPRRLEREGSSRGVEKRPSRDRTDHLDRRSRDNGRSSRDRDRGSRDDRHRSSRDMDRRRSTERDPRRSRDVDRRASRDRERRRSRDRRSSRDRERKRSRDRRSSRDRDRRGDKHRRERSRSRDKKRSKRSSSRERRSEKSSDKRSRDARKSSESSNRDRKSSESSHKDRKSLEKPRESEEESTNVVDAHARVTPESNIKASIQSDGDYACNNASNHDDPRGENHKEERMEEDMFETASN